MFQPLINAVITADEIYIEKLNGEISAIVPIAREGDTIVSLVCRATLVSYGDEFFYEFSFFLMVIPEASDLAPNDKVEDLEIWTPKAAEPYIPQQIREFLLPTVCEGYKALIREIDRMSIYRVTHGAHNLGEEPQRNEILTKTIEDEGYRIEEKGIDELGRVFWKMVKI
jgi:hypothetical protein